MILELIPIFLHVRFQIRWNIPQHPNEYWNTNGLNDSRSTEKSTAKESAVYIFCDMWGSDRQLNVSATDYVFQNQADKDMYLYFQRVNRRHEADWNGLKV